MKNYSERLVPFRNFVSMADMIVATFGDNCEVVIHDFTDLNHSLVYINGNVTGRELGAPPSNLIIKEFYKYKDNVQDRFAFMARTNDGKILKTSITFIRDDHGKVIGCMGINFDMTDLVMVNKLVGSITKTQGIEIFDTDYTEEYYPKNIEDVFNHMIETTKGQFPFFGEDMKREDKLHFVELLDEKGVFTMQGAIEKVSGLLNVTKQSVYKYLEEIRAKSEKSNER